MKTSKKLIKTLQKHKLASLVFILSLLLLGFYLNTNFQKHSTSAPASVVPTNSPKINYNKLSFDIPSDWKSYTTNNSLDAHPDILKKHPGLKIPNLSFKYPNTWYVKTLVKSSTLDTSFPLTIEIRKTHPRNVDIHQYEGLLPDNASFDMYLGITPKGLEDFYFNFWGFGHAHTRTDYFTVNDVPLVLGYYSSDYVKEELVSALFKISPTTQLMIRIGFENTDSQCITEYCTQTTAEILKILSTFKFTN